MKIIPLIIAICLSGCASIVSTITDGHPNLKRVVVPNNTEVTQSATDYDLPIPGVQYDDHTKMAVNRGDGPFKPNIVRLNAFISRDRLNPWVFGNILYGGFPGFIIDGLTGAMWDPRVPVLKAKPVK